MMIADALTGVFVPLSGWCAGGRLVCKGEFDINQGGRNSRKEDVDDLSNKSVAKEGRLVHLADRPQEATLAVQPKREQEVLDVLFKWVIY